MVGLIRLRKVFGRWLEGSCASTCTLLAKRLNTISHLETAQPLKSVDAEIAQAAREEASKVGNRAPFGDALLERPPIACTLPHGPSSKEEGKVPGSPRRLNDLIVFEDFKQVRTVNGLYHNKTNQLRLPQ
jgi:hypothetical protein